MYQAVAWLDVMSRALGCRKLQCICCRQEMQLEMQLLNGHSVKEKPLKGGGMFS